MLADATVLGRDVIVWGMILEYLTLQQLAALRCTSRFFRDTADGVLLRRLHITALGYARVARS